MNMILKADDTLRNASADNENFACENKSFLYNAISYRGIYQNECDKDNPKKFKRMVIRWEYG